MLREEECRTQIESHHRIEIIQGHISEGFWAIGAGIVHQNIEGLGCHDRGFRRRQIIHIQGQSLCRTTLGADRRRCCFNLMGAAGQ